MMGGISPVKDRFCSGVVIIIIFLFTRVGHGGDTNQSFRQVLRHMPTLNTQSLLTKGKETKREIIPSIH